MILGAHSRYREVLAAHEGLTGSARRPDVTLVRKQSNGSPPTVMLIEVKETGFTRYASDSIYKAFGYLYDFGALWNSGQPGPRLVLLFPENVAPRSGLDFSAQDVLLVSSVGTSALAEAIKTRFEFD